MAKELQIPGDWQDGDDGESLVESEADDSEGYEEEDEEIGEAKIQHLPKRQNA